MSDPERETPFLGVAADIIGPDGKPHYDPTRVPGLDDEFTDEELQRLTDAG